MHYPDYSQLWLNDVTSGRAEALGSSPDYSASDSLAPLPASALKPNTAAYTALGKRVSLGRYDNEPLTWTVISVNNDHALLFCDTVLPAVQLHEGCIDSSAPGWWCETPSWPNTDIRTWLNLTFYGDALACDFSAFVEPAFMDHSPNPDKVVIPSAEEAQAYIPQALRACGNLSWWLRNPSSWDSDGQPTYVNEQGEICAGGSAHDERGVRPLITVKLWE